MDNFLFSIISIYKIKRICRVSLVTLILVQAVVVVVLQVSHELLRGEVVVVLKQGLERLLPVLPVGSLELTKARFEEKNPLGTSLILD